jgi:hypothetical protein
LQDGSGNAISSTGNKLDVNQNALAAGTDSVDARMQDGAGTALTSTTDGAKERLDVAIQALTAAAQAISSWTKDGAGNAITSTGNKLDVAQNALASGTDSVDSYLNDGAGNAIGSTAGALDVNLAALGAGSLQTYEGHTSPNYTTKIVQVQVGDVGADYVAGSVGQVKTALLYLSGAAPGSPAKLTTYKYADSANPILFTERVETTSVSP